MLRFNHHFYPHRRYYADRRLNFDDSSSSSTGFQAPPPQPPTATTTTHPPAKPNPKLLSFVLQAFVMTLVFSLFFVFVGIAVIIFLHLCLVGGALHRRHRRRNRPRGHLNTDQLGLTPAELRALPKFKSRPRTKDLCAICLENCAEGDWCRELPDCKHVFHANCVDRWLAKSPGCPVCRTTVSLGCRNDGEITRNEDFSDRLWHAFG